MRDALVLTHSWLRWIVVAAGAYVALHLLRTWLTHRPWSGRDNYLVWAFGRAFLYQALFGVVLYIMLSATLPPVLPSRELDTRLGVPMHWPLLHGLAMLAALGLFHGGKALVYRRVPLRHRAAAMLGLMLGVLALILAAIPWPHLKFGRPLFRFFQL